MPEILAKNDKLIFAATTISDGSMSRVERKEGEDKASFDERSKKQQARIEAALAPIVPSARSFHVTRVVHGDRIVQISDTGESGMYKDIDGFIIDIPGKALIVTGADCPPVFLADEALGRIALVHSGRKSTLLNIAGKAVRELMENGSRPDSITAVIGPGICGKCYEVSPEITEEFMSDYPDAVTSRSYLDLPKIIRTQLIRLGIAPERIQDAGGCTFENPDKWFSYRRDVRDKLELDHVRVQAFVGMLQANSV